MPQQPDDVVRIALTFAWEEDVAHPGTGPHVPPIDALAQLFYTLDILYVETLDPQPRHGGSLAPSTRRLQGLPAQWVKVATRLMTAKRVEGAEWPRALLLPAVDASQTLRVESMVMASPLELLLAIPAVVVPTSAALVKLVTAIETTWNARGRIRLEQASLRRDTALADFETAAVKELMRDRFELIEGSVTVPDEHTLA